MPLPSGHILLVEDNDDEVLLIQRAFKKANVDATIEVVRDGQAAIDWLAASDIVPDVVILDLKLPKRSGFEVLESLQDRPDHVPPVVVFSNSAEATDIRRAYSLGANSYVRKPTSFDMLVEFVSVLNTYWLSWNTPLSAATS